ncbi:hypothetical protein P3T76_010311 [Phytophthora citrophthora]|uniref:Uncharacterized protein n=1 Tax=Phytophthora citrophthora TaxID=4793 RepID=A0AAD9LGM8_9STRA|nr:hypothetical protein P3T76_010311 [Phytophthora citrophthora]
MNMYKWLDWVIMDHHELVFCEKKRAEVLSIEPTNANTLKANMEPWRRPSKVASVSVSLANC